MKLSPIFTLFADGEPPCISKGYPGGLELYCSFQNQLTSIVCSFDGLEQENCSFPLVVESNRFGTEPHVVDVTVTDENGEYETITLDFLVRNGMAHF